MQPRELLRLSYRVGIMADALAAMMMLGQAIFGHQSSLTGFVPDLPYRYSIGLAGSLMVGWTLLLIWADRDPVARRGILPVTVVVLLGMMATAVAAALAGFTTMTKLLPMILIELALVILFSVSYLLSRQHDNGSDEPER